MCGIGLLHRKNNTAKEFIKPFMEPISYRGPDYQQVVSITNQTSIANSRLALIDNHPRSNQPYKVDNCYLSFNGAIYNFKELRTDLSRSGVIFETEGDTEVVLKGYLKQGISFFEKMSGMWSLVIYDSLRNKIILSRDRFGIKPLYYKLDSKGLTVGSELKQFTNIADLKLTYNEDQISLYLETGFQNTSHQTIWKDVFQIKPGHYATYNIEQHKWKNKKYYDLKTTKKEDTENWEELLERSIVDRCIADVNPAILLSGGLDSSVLAYELNQQTTLKSYSYIDKVASEEVYVDAFLQKYPHQNYKLKIDHNEWTELVATVVRIQDQPFPSLSVLADYRLQLAANKNGEKLMISGQGADEIMGGYIKNWSLLPRHMLLKSPGQLLSFSSKYAQKLPKLLKGYSHTQLTNYIYKKPVISSVQEYMYHLINNAGLRDLLHFADRNSMANSIEVRVPFLDHKLVEAAYHMPDNIKLEGLIRKAPLIKKYKSKLPKKILSRTVKYAYDTPEQFLYKQGMVNLKEEYNKLKERLPHLINDVDIEKVSSDKVALAWRLYFLNHWLEIYPSTI